MLTPATAGPPGAGPAVRQAPPSPAENTVPSGAPKAEGACQACEHLATEHDGISRRYCDATVERALTRRCICQPAR